MHGSLHKYGNANAQTAFLSGNTSKHVVVVGGLGDGFIFAPYIPQLAALTKQEWALVQPMLRSVLGGWGVGSLAQDADDIHQLACWLKREQQSEGFVLIGHSTGCQDAMRYAQEHARSSDAAPLKGVILQAPVSDREWQASRKGTTERLRQAQQMLEQKQGEEILFRDHEMGGTPVTAARYASLAGHGGDDDMFSSDFSDAELQEKMRPLLDTPTLVVVGGKDECYPAGMDIEGLGRRLTQAAGQQARLAYIQGGDHSMTGCEQQFCDAVDTFLKHIGFATGNVMQTSYLQECT